MAGVPTIHCVTRPKGMVTIVSIFEEPIQFNPMSLTASGVRISSSLAYKPDIFEATIKMIESGQIIQYRLLQTELNLTKLWMKVLKKHNLKF